MMNTTVGVETILQVSHIFFVLTFNLDNPNRDFPMNMFHTFFIEA